MAELNAPGADSGASAPAKQAGFLVIGQNLASLAEALTLLVIVRLMGKAEVGVLGALLLIYQTVALIAQSGFPSSLIYFMPSRPDAERRAIAWQFARTLFLLGVGAGVVMVLLALLDGFAPGLLAWSPPSAASAEATQPAEASPSLQYLYLFALYPLADVPMRMLTSLLVAEKRAQSVAWVSMLRGIGQTLFTVVPIALGQSLWIVVGSLTVWGYLYGTLLLYFLAKLYPGVARVPSPISSRQLFAFSLPLGATAVVSLLNARIDQYLILFAFPAERFAEYQAGAWQIPVVTSLVYPVGAAFMSRWRELFAQGDNQGAIDVWRETALKVSNVVVPVSMVFVIAAEETITLLFTADYVAAAGVFRYYALLTMLRVATFGNVITAAGRPKLVLYAALLSLLANALLSPLLLWLVGFEGPAIAALLAFFPMLLVYCHYVALSAGVPLSRTFPLLGYLKAVLAAALAGALALWLVRFTPESPALRLGLVAVTVLGGYGLLGSLTGIVTRQDWRYLGGWFGLRTR